MDGPNPEEEIEEFDPNDYQSFDLIIDHNSEKDDNIKFYLNENQLFDNESFKQNILLDATDDEKDTNNNADLYTSDFEELDSESIIGSAYYEKINDDNDKTVVENTFIVGEYIYNIENIIRYKA
ncbi:uncharacterized protein LOC116418343 [Nasonia vitripennis]|uniref:Uncharacterized protein n=1 Tax=Nasonia vitripennis TaxID=7425 RepID=A0A7M7TBH0_NASVI|nr:uncharacterized protein LOC116418109 [Nasonia vitripennis]XP_031789287.1 uncharacterized protein LOC116418343 [Nasonia vitripennis]